MGVRALAEVPGGAPVLRDRRRCRGGGVWRRGRTTAMLEKARLGGGVLERGEAGEPWSGACCAATTPRRRLQRQMRRAAACAGAPSHSQPCLPGSVVPSRQSVLDGGRRALSPITEHRNVETRTWWIVRERWSDFASQSQLYDRVLICLPPGLYATLHSHQMGRPSSLGSQASALRPAYRWLAWRSGVRLPACAGGVSGPGRVGGVTPVERRKGSNRAQVTRPWWRHGHPVRLCAWCAHPVHGDAVTVTFPDKAQVTFHAACLDQYRAVMGPRAAP
jgi:hypothetical protein